YLSDAAIETIKTRPRGDENDGPLLNVLDWRKLGPLPSDDGEGAFQGDIAAVNLEMLERLSAQTNPEAADVTNAEESVRGTNVFLFVTRDGTHGALQMSPLTDGSRGVRLRYKLVKTGDAATAS